MTTIVNETVGAVFLTGHILWLLFQYFANLVIPTVHSVKGEVAIITGGGNGIGRCACVIVSACDACGQDTGINFGMIAHL